MTTKFQEAVSEALFRLHEQAMDASADPTTANINAVRNTWKQVQRLLPSLYFERASTTRIRDIAERQGGNDVR